MKMKNRTIDVYEKLSMLSVPKKRLTIWFKLQPDTILLFRRWQYRGRLSPIPLLTFGDWVYR